MSQNKKTIQITPELFKISREGKSKKTKSQTRKKPTAIKNNPLKRELMNKIKEHAKKNNKTLKNRENHDSTTFESHMDYLLTLSKKQKLKVNTELPNELKKVQESPESAIGGRSKITIKPLIEVQLSSIKPKEKENAILSIVSPTPVPHTEEPTPVPTAAHTINIKKDPEYGILKRGKKPTYRQWYHNKTVRNRPQISKPNELIQEVKSIYKLGRRKKTRKVSIFLKNKKTIRKMQEEVNIIKAAPINDVKDYLRKHNIIKSGSCAPHDVLRQLYQQTHLAGEINNNSNENVIHNYLADDNEESTS
tara:strand:- start:1994 stop:2911 length:918 start_codon:yes stop_codon:yes gene_type:complete